MPTRAVPKVVFNGLQGTEGSIVRTTNRFRQEQDFASLPNDADASVARGTIKTAAVPIPGGARLTVQTTHAQKNDPISLFLIAEVLDPDTNDLRTITLSILANNQNLNGQSFRGEVTVDLDYAALNAFLASKNPNLKITPETTSLAVAGVWADGHQAGGFSRGGAFRLPYPQGAAPRPAQATTAASRKNLTEPSLPLDLEVAFTPELQKRASSLKPEGSIVSRLESELKGTTDRATLKAAIRKMYQAVESIERGDASLAQALVGKDWTIEAEDRYWLKDSGHPNQPGKQGTGFFKGFRVDEDGLPLQDPMRDGYLDDAQLRMTRHEGAIRLRTNRAATQINVKPGGGRVDPRTRITQRIEVGVDMRPGSTTEEAATTFGVLASGSLSKSIFNHAQHEVTKIAPELNLANALSPWLDVVQDRHKFIVRNVKTGVEVEFSFDDVKAKTVRPEQAQLDGQPRESHFYVLEAELDHLQLAGRKGAQTTAAMAGSRQLTTDEEQDRWLKQTGPRVTMAIDPRLHELEDLQNESFRKTTSYSQFEQILSSLTPKLFPKGLAPGKQKSAYAAELMGLVFTNAKDRRQGVKAAIEEGGYQWTPALDAWLKDLEKTPELVETLSSTLASERRSGIAQALAPAKLNAPLLEYDAARVKARTHERLAELGYEATPQVDALLEQLPNSQLPPTTFEQILLGLDPDSGPALLSPLALALDVADVPAAKPAPAMLIRSPAWRASIERTFVEQGWDTADLPALLAFLDKHSASISLSDANVLERKILRSATPQEALASWARRLNAPEEGLPVVHASIEKIFSGLGSRLPEEYVLLNDELDSFLRAYARTASADEAHALSSKTGNSVAGIIAQMAERTGLKAPKLATDFDQLNRALDATARTQLLALDESVKTFLKRLVDSGVSAVTVAQAMAQVSTAGSLAAALKSLSVALPKDIPPPAVSLDEKALTSRVKAALGNLAPLLKPGSLERYVRESLKSGVPSGELAAWAEETARHGLTYTRSRFAQRGSSSSKGVLLPWSVDAIVAVLKTSVAPTTANGWTLGLDVASRKALEPAVESPNVGLVTALSEVLDFARPPSPLPVSSLLERLARISRSA